MMRLPQKVEFKKVAIGRKQIQLKIFIFYKKGDLLSRLFLSLNNLPNYLLRLIQQIR